MKTQHEQKLRNMLALSFGDHALWSKAHAMMQTLYKERRRYHMKKVLVAGSTGYLGQYVIKELKKRGIIFVVFMSLREGARGRVADARSKKPWGQAERIEQGIQKAKDKSLFWGAYPG